MTSYFWLAVIMSLAGPFFYQWACHKGSVSKFFDGLITTALICLVTLHILPESLSRSTITTIVAVTFGLLGPVLLSKLTNRGECEIQKPFLIISIFGFVAHNMLDGAALIVHPDAHNSTHLLALAVGLHRFIESIAVWKTTSRSFGTVISSVILAMLSLAMVGGYSFGEQIFLKLDESILHTLQALACGMIFHVVLHPHHLREFILDAKQGKLLAKMQSFGAFCGLVLAILAYLFWPAHIH